MHYSVREVFNWVQRVGRHLSYSLRVRVSTIWIERVGTFKNSNATRKGSFINCVSRDAALFRPKFTPRRCNSALVTLDAIYERAFSTLASTIIWAQRVRNIPQFIGLHQHRLGIYSPSPFCCFSLWLIITIPCAETKPSSFAYRVNT